MDTFGEAMIQPTTLNYRINLVNERSLLKGKKHRFPLFLFIRVGTGTLP